MSTMRPIITKAHDQFRLYCSDVMAEPNMMTLINPNKAEIQKKYIKYMCNAYKICLVSFLLFYSKRMHKYSNEKSIFQNRPRIHDNNLHTYTYCFSTWETCTCCNSLIECPHPPNSFVSACKEKGVVILIRLMLEKHWIYEFNVHDFQILGRRGGGCDNFIEYIL